MRANNGRPVAALLTTIVVLASVSSAFARVGGDARLDHDIAPGVPGWSSYERDLPVRAPNGGARADTISFGYFTVIGGNKYAVEGETWTWDHGAADPLEGWYSKDLSANDGAYFRRIDASSWTGHGNTVTAPIPAGNGAAWVGLFEDEADARCWPSGLGYGNNWVQRWQSPLVTYDGSGDVQLAFEYFNDTEADFDYTRVLVRLASGTEFSLNGAGFDGVVGNPATSNYVEFGHVIAEGDFEGETEFRIVFEFDSDGGWSDQDGAYETDYSGFGVDNVSFVGNLVGGDLVYDYESGAQGWTAQLGPSIGLQMGINEISDYVIADDCACELSGAVLEMHDDSPTPEHPTGQHEIAFSPPVDKSRLDPSFNSIFADWDAYGEMPQASGVFYRPGWNYYPYICPSTGATQWSGRIGQETFFQLGANAICADLRVSATNHGVPAAAELVGFVWEIYASCDAFAIAPTNCTGVSNFSPIIDNVQIRMTHVAAAPPIVFDPGTYFIDGFGQMSHPSPGNAGNADIVYDRSLGTENPSRLGDSLLVVGPTSGPAWDAKLWWRIRREGPSQGAIPNYNTWKTNVADGLSIVGPAGQFTFGQMDSAQSGSTALKSRRISEFRENDDDFAGEFTNNNEMIRDGILAPGTQIQYFVTSSFASSPTEYFYLPDTSGGNYLEFEILPSYRLDGGVAKCPCVLTIDTNSGEQKFVENALNVALNGAAPADPIPNPTLWDRYDYADASSNWNASLYRMTGGNNGTTVPQMNGYRQVILYVGDAAPGAMETGDFTLLSEWLDNSLCTDVGVRQGLILNGDNLAHILTSELPFFLQNELGASLVCDAYHAPTCGPTPNDESYCVRLETAAGAQYPPAIAYDAWGNWCPQRFSMDVLATAAGGIGNRVFNDYDNGGVATNYAQVVKTVTGPGSGNYRSVLDGVAYGHLSARDGTEECVGDSSHIVSAVANEISQAMQWIFTGAWGIPTLCHGLCIYTGVDEVLEGGALSTRLSQNHPNPFNPRTTIRYSLAVAGAVELTIYDVNGRKVKALVDGVAARGEHMVVWDGTDDAGHKVGSGVYWSQLTAGEYRSNKKMVILK